MPRRMKILLRCWQNIESWFKKNNIERKQYKYDEDKGRYRFKTATIN